MIETCLFSTSSYILKKYDFDLQHCCIWPDPLIILSILFIISSFFYLSCLRMISNGVKIDFGIKAVLGMADYCQAALDTSTWPAWQLCNIFSSISWTSRSLTSWYGVGCSSRCYFGTHENTNCRCSRGFWGTECRYVCNGGLIRPCNGQGFCIKSSGTCKCNTNWRGSVNCDMCSEGYEGKDCSVSIVDSGEEEVHSSTLFSGGFTRTLDGVRVRLNRTGEFVAYKSKDGTVEAQTRLVRRRRSVFVDAASVRVGRDNVGVTSKLDGNISVSINGQEIDQNSKVQLSSSGAKYERKSSHVYEVSSGGGFHMVIYRKNSALDLEFSVPRNTCAGAIGILGSCSKQSNGSGEIFGGYNVSSFTRSDLLNYTMKWQVKLNESLIQPALNASRLPSFITAAGSCLYISGNGIVTPELVGIFSASDVSLQIMFKVSDSDSAGSLVSFGRNRTVSIVVNGTIFIHAGKTTIDTGLIVDSGKWIQLSLVYQRKTKVLQIYLCRSTVFIQRKVLVVDGEWFEDGSILGIGLWVASLRNPVSLQLSKFVGWVDDLRIWNTRIDAVTIQAMWGKDVVEGESNLVAIWKMNEGGGGIVKDGVGSYDIVLPSKDSMRPAWMAADYVTSEATVSVNETRLNEQRTAADKTCFGIIYSEVMNRTCLTVLGSGANFYFTSCIEGILLGNENAAFDALLAYSTECKSVGKLSELPGRELCNLMPGKYFNQWYGPSCSRKCVFGTVYILNATCICDKGYWGTSCDQVCPGGASSPCSGNGVCDVKTGTCFCNPNYQGSVTCDKCSDGWFGTKCEYVRDQWRGDVQPTCIVGEDGRYKAFDLLRFEVDRIGRYLLLNDGSVYIYADHIPCYALSFCINNIVIQESGQKIQIPTTSRSTDSLLLKIGNKTVSDIAPEGFVFQHTITIRRVDPVIVEIQLRDNFLLKVKQNNDFLSIYLESVKSSCTNLTGLCGSCKSVIDTSSKRFLSVGKVAVSHYALHCLYFESATIFSDKIPILTSNSITFEFLVKSSCSASICGGALVTYASHVSFCISNYVTLRVYIDNEVYDTGIATETGKWNQIFVSVSTTTLKMEIFIASSSSVVSYGQFKLKSNPISSGGVLSVGSWTPSLRRITIQPKESFKGEIDELRIWARSFDFSSVKAKVFSNPRYKATDLLCAWKFNEGRGDFTVDLVNGLKLYLPAYPWKRPSWKQSDAPLVAPNFGNEVDDSDLRKRAEVFCTNVLVKSPMGVSCSPINKDAKTFYVKQCVEAIVKKGILSAALSTTISFADYCQNSLKLGSWPAQPLCNAFPGTRFPNWIGDDCTVPCSHGEKDKLKPNICKCDFGYWGDSCNETCDGGFTHPCSDHGICDTKTGKCACYPNWQGDTNCSRCTLGLTGKDCTIVDNNQVANAVKVNFGQLGFQGLILMFGRTGIHIDSPGEFTLLYTSKFKFVIQARYVSCLDDNSVCLVAISIKISKQIIIIRAPFVSSQNIIVWLNGKIHDIYTSPILKRDFGFTLIRVSTSAYRLSTLHGDIRIVVAGKYLSLQLDITREVCEEAIGLLGNCKESVGKVLTEQATLPSCRAGVFVNETVVHSQVAVDLKSLTEATVQQFINQYSVKECDSLFIYKYKNVIEYREGNAGYSLKFNDTAFTLQNTTYITSSKHFTLDFMIQVLRPGTILSYGYRTVFVLAVNGSELYVLVNNIRYSTTLHVQLNVWNQIILQWDRGQRVLYLCVIYKDGTLERNEIAIGVELFTSQDILTFGKWQPAMNVSNPHPPGTFVGFFDEIKIWSRLFSPSLIWQLMSKTVKVDSEGLVKLFELNEGTGVKVMDKLTGTSEILTNIPWRKPEWEHSSLVLTRQPRLKTLSEDERTTRKSQDAFTTCKKLLKSGSLAMLCHNTGQGIISQYFKSCQDVLLKAGRSKEALRIVVIFADFCMHTLNLSRWPAHELCDQFARTEMPLEMYDRCRIRCLYGNESNNATCDCFAGYWGENCSHICPGGSWNPCRNNGFCNSRDGYCECAVNWNGSSDCGKCKHEWQGKDCSFSSVTLNERYPTVYISGGTISVLGGVAIEFRYTGAFVLYEDLTSKVRIEILQLPCHSIKVCTKSIAIRIEARVLIVAVGLNGSPPRVYVDGRFIAITSTDVHINGVNGTLSASLESSSAIVVRKDSGLRLKIWGIDQELIVSLMINNRDCHMRRGLIAHCKINTTEKTSDDISRELYNDTLVDATKSDIPNWIMMNSRHNAGEMAVYFHRTMALTSPLCRSLKNSSDITFEMLLRPYSKNGIVISFAKTSVFSFFLADSFRLSIGRQVLDTGMVIKVGEWYYTAFVWKASMYRLEVYIGTGHSSIERRTFFLNDEPFVSCGWLSIGGWIPSANMLVPPSTDAAAFRIDEIRIWSKAIDSVAIQQNYRMNIIKSYDSLTALWKMNEGNGLLVKNHVGEEHIYLSEKFATKPVWVLSDADVETKISPLVADSKSLTKESAGVKKYCHDLFFTGSLLTECHGLGATRDLSYAKCIKDVTANSYNRSFALLSVISFADECQVVLNLTTWPARLLCNSFPGLQFPYWIGDKCDLPCIFGQADWNNRNICRCDFGFWGQNCTNECPGGANNPCSRHGRCDVNNGTCDCYENWNGDNSCSKCAENWSGNNCEVVRTSKTFMSCSFLSGGNVITLNGTATRLLNAGEFYMYRNAKFNLSIKGLQGHCGSGLVLCLRAIAIETEGNEIKMFAPWNNNDRPRIQANGAAVFMSERLMDLSGVSIFQASKSKFEFTLQKTVVFHVRVIKSELSLNLKITGEYCSGDISICGSCDDAVHRNLTIDASRLESAVRVEAQYLSFESDIERMSRFSLQFQRVGISTNVLTDIYLRTNLTFEIRFIATPLAVSNSTLICYSQSASFGVIIKRTVHIVISTSIYDTGFAVEANATNQVTLVYEYLTRKLTLYFTNSRGLIWFHPIVLPKSIVLFDKLGVISIGQWISSKETKFFLPARGFEGVIETMRIWKRAYSYLDVKALFTSEISLYDTDLISQWDFSEGSGNVVRDVVSKVGFYLPADAKAPSWILSSMKKRKTKVFEDPEFTSKHLKEEAARKCRSILFESDLYGNCKNLGNDTIG